MKKIDLEQGSLEWLEYRFSHRNASEAATIMGVDPWTTPRQLWERNRDKSFAKLNPAMAHGNNMEAAARAKASEVIGEKFEPAIFEEGEYSASFDGFANNVKVEIKCPYQGVNSQTWRQMQQETNRIPEHYVWQLVHQCYVCPTQETYFFVFIDNDTWDMAAFRPSAEQTLALLAAWDVFCATEPDPEFRLVDDEATVQLVNRHAELVAMQKDIDAELKAIKTELEQFEDNVIVGDTRIQWVERKGNVQYAKVPQLEGVDLDAYRGKGSRYLKITH